MTAFNPIYGGNNRRAVKNPDGTYTLSATVYALVAQLADGTNILVGPLDTDTAQLVITTDPVVPTFLP